MKFDTLIEMEQTAALGGGAARVSRQHAKGKQTARERVQQLLDEGSFLEVDAYWTHRHSDFGMDEKRTPGDSVVVTLQFDATVVGPMDALLRIVSEPCTYTREIKLRAEGLR